MALTKEQVRKSAHKLDYNDEFAAYAIRHTLRIIKTLYSEMPWYKKLILTIKWLISGLEEFVNDVYEKH